MSYTKVKLGSLIKQVRGVSYGQDDVCEVPIVDHIPLLRANNISSNYSLNKDKLVYVALKKVSEEQYLKKGDIVIAASSGSIDIVGKAANFEGEEELTFGAFCKVIRPNTKLVLPKFIGFFFQSDYYRNRISFLAQGANINNLRNEHINNLEIPLPDIDTQNKIIAILDKSKNLILKREESINKLNDLLVSKFIAFFGNIYKNEKRWQEYPIGNYIDKLIAGSSYGGDEKRTLKDNELGVLKVSAVTKGIFNPKEYKAVSKSLITKKIISPTKGDLLFSRANTPELVGATCIVDEDYPQLFLPDKLWNIVVDENHIRKPYLHYLLQDINFKKTLTQYATGSSGSMYNISMESLRNLVCPIPPIEIQIEFENIFNKTTLIRKKLINSLDEIINLSKVLLQKAFKGELEFKSELPLNIEIELEILLENDYEYFKQYHTKKNIETLVDRLNKNPLNQNKFTVKEEYNKAKQFVFDLLKDKKIKQVFNEKTKSIELQVV